MKQCECRTLLDFCSLSPASSISYSDFYLHVIQESPSRPQFFFFFFPKSNLVCVAFFFFTLFILYIFGVEQLIHLL